MSGWPEVALSEVFDIARGGSPRPIDDFVTDSPDGINWVTIGDASEGSKYITRTKRRIRREGVSRSREVKPGDFLLTNSMSFGRPYIMRTSGCIHDGWLMLSPRRANVDGDFFYHLLGSKRLYSEFERLAAGATVKNLNIDIVRSVKVVLPPLPEQRRIAAILDKADDLRAKRRAALEQLNGLTQAMFLEMFGDMATNPRGWRLRRLGEVASEFRYGTSNKSQERGKATLRIPNVIHGTIDTSDLKLVPVDDAEFERIRLVDGDILFVRTNGNPDFVGRCAVFDSRLASASSGYAGDEFAFASYLIRLRLKADSICPVFLREFMMSPQGRRELRYRSKTSAGQFNINTEGLASIDVPIPPCVMQQEFEQRECAIRRVTESQEASTSRLDGLLASLQDQAFSGAL